MSEQLSRLSDAIADEYLLETEIGAGGMAIVYLAHDRKHDRKVAVKVLRPDIAATLGAERFLREVRIAANLTHPHILGLHDSGEADGFLYYVMPFIEGESLRDRVAREGELPVHDAIRIIKEVVDALSYAHAQNVVHRDVKPDNVLLSGRHAMVTDFGVAKAVSEATGRDKLTTAGVALGTPSYMAPEQASAEPHIDHRVDLYAVGVLAYELLTGRLPFEGTTQQQVLAAHLTETPRPPSARRPSLSPLIDQFVLKCLEKRPSDRWQTADEMLPMLEALSTPSGGVTPTTGTAPATGVSHAPRPVTRTGIVAATAIAAVIVGFVGWTLLRSQPRTVEIANIRQVTRADELELDPAISPDGGEVAYGADGEIFVMDLEGGRPIALSGEHAGASGHPQWTADGRSVAFTVDVREDDFGEIGSASIVLVPRFGGAAREIGAGWLWDLEGDRAVSVRSADSVFVGPLDDPGSSEFVVAVARPHSAVLSPDGAKVAFVQGNRDYAMASPANIAPSAIWIVDAAGGEPVRVTDHPSLNTKPVWLGDSQHLLFVSNRDGARDLYLVEVDGAGRPRRPPTRVSAGLEPHSVSVSADGRTAVYSRFLNRQNVRRYRLPASGALSLRDGEQITTGNQIVESHGLSADGQWFAYDANLAGNQDIYIISTDGGEPRALTTDPADDFNPDFSPDGQDIAFHSTRFGTRDIMAVDVNGRNVRRLTDLPGEEFHAAYSPDGGHIAFSSIEPGGRWVYVMTRNMDGQWDPPRRISSGQDTFYPRWSPDGQRILAHVPNGLVTLDLEGNVTIVLSESDAGFANIDWADYAPDGQTLYFRGVRGGESGIYAMPVGGGTPRLVIRFDEPRWDPFLVMTVGDGVIYLSVGEPESDIYAMDLEYR